MGDKKKKPKRPLTHEELKGFDIQINAFGQVKTSYDVEKLNKFLDVHTEDKKLMDRKSEEE